MIYTVRKNQHSFTPRPFKLVTAPYITRKVMFDYSCKYDLKDKDQDDINKLFGIGYFPHHKRNSARVGWRWNIKKQLIEIFSYIYVRGKRIDSELLASVKLGLPYEMSLYVESDFVYYLIKDHNNIVVTTQSVNIPKPIRSIIGYQLNPFFGGNKKSPHSISINIQKP